MRACTTWRSPSWARRRRSGDARSSSRRPSGAPPTPLCFVEQMQEIRERFGVLQETSLSPQQRDDWCCRAQFRSEKVGFAEAQRGGQDLRPPREWLVHSGRLTDGRAQTDHLYLSELAAARPRNLSPSSACLWGMTDMCTSLMGAGQECIVKLLDSAASFIGSCKLF